MADASIHAAATAYSLTAGAAIQIGDVWQLPDGRSGVFSGTAAAAEGDTASFLPSYIHVYTKKSGFVALEGGRAYWDHSANAVNYRRTGDRDFYLGRFYRDAESAAETCTVNTLRSEFDGYGFDLNRHGGLSVLVGTPAAGGFGYPVKLGGAHVFELSSTSEAQKVDFLGEESFANDSNLIVEFILNIINNGSGSAPDFNIGVASDTHASDASSITQRMLVQFDGNSLNINVGAADGMSVSVSLTDTTVDHVEGSGLANMVEGWIDFRDEEDVKVYINGSRVLSSTPINMAAASSEWKPLIHLEKTSSADVYKAMVHQLLVRTSEQ